MGSSPPYCLTSGIANSQTPCMPWPQNWIICGRTWSPSDVPTLTSRFRTCGGFTSTWSCRDPPPAQNPAWRSTRKAR
eukprot:6306403-Pyramimonas_sp.AAC.1